MYTFTLLVALTLASEDGSKLADYEIGDYTVIDYDGAPDPVAALCAVHEGKAEIIARPDMIRATPAPAPVVCKGISTSPFGGGQ